jgi:hypothetical protein
MDIHRQSSGSFDRLDNHRPHRDVGNKSPVHDIHVNPVCTGGFNRLHFHAELGEICGEDGRCDLDVGHNAPTLITSFGHGLFYDEIAISSMLASWMDASG